METQELPPIGSDVTHLIAGGGGLPPIGSDVTHLIEPDFKATAEKPSLLDLGVELVKGFGAQMNPLPLLKAMYDRTADEFDQALTAGKEGRYGDAFLHATEIPSAPGQALVHGLTNAHLDQFKKAYQAFQEGRLSEALGHTLAGVVPIVGPAAAGVGEEIGTGDPRTMAHGVGGAIALVAPAALKYGTEVARTGSILPSAADVAAAPPLRVQTPAPLANPNAADVAAVDFGAARGIPVDAATATGNKAIAGAQHLADRTLGGSLVGAGAAARQAEGFTRVGNELAADAYPHPTTPETAGADVRGAVEKLIGDLHGQASDAYERLRALEADPANAAEVPKSGLAPKVVAAAEDAKIAKMSETLGYVPKLGEMAELRRIKAEMDSLPFVKRTWNDLSGEVGKRGNAAGGDAQIVPGAAGAVVYTDIMQRTDRNGDLLVPSEMTRREVRDALDKALTTGRFTNAAKAALEVARGRMRGDTGLSKPSLPPSAGDLAPSQTTMLMPVDIRPTKTALDPMYQQLKREAELVPLQGGKARALVALDRLLNGPDFAPVSVADAALGDLKAMARGADLPALRTGTQSIAANAVKQLGVVVRQAVERAGPEAVAALEEGRNATVAKYAAADVLDSLRQEPVQVFRQAIASKDAGIDQLRAVVDHGGAGEITKIGRAYLEDLMQQATADGAFDRAKGLAAKWQNLGPQTKTLLFGKELTTDLNNFFHLAKKAADNPNPSGTGHTVALWSQGGLMVMNPVKGVAVQIAGAAAAKLLRSPTFVKAVTKGFSISVQNYPAAAAVFGQIVKAAGADAVRVPTAAGLLTPGNIDLAHRPRVTNADGSTSTVRSISIEQDGEEILIPTVSADGRLLSDADAIAAFKKTGQHLGIFDSAAHATAYARTLHADQARLLDRQAEQ